MNSFYINSGNIKLHVLAEDEDNTKETLLFIHGYPDDSNSWTNQFAYFRSKYRLAAFDLRGIRNPFQKEIPESFKMEDLMEDIQAVIHFLVGDNRKVHLIGHDWGAVISWCFVSDPKYKNKLYSYTAISCPHPRIMYDNFASGMISFNPETVWKSLSQLARSWYIFFYQIPNFGEILWNTSPKFFWNILMDKANLPKNDPMRNYDSAEILKCTIGNINLYRSIIQSMQIPDLPYEKITLPICLIIPERDLVLSPMVYATTSNYYSNLEEHVLQANHWVHREQAALVNKIMENFLAKSVKTIEIHFHLEWNTDTMKTGEILIQLKNQFLRMAKGEVLKIKSTERDLKDSLVSWSRLTGNLILKFSENEFYIKKI